MFRGKMSELGSTNQRSCRLWLRVRDLVVFDVHISEQHSSCPAVTCSGQGNMEKKGYMPVQALPQGRLYVHARGRQGNCKAATHTAPGSKLP